MTQLLTCTIKQKSEYYDIVIESGLCANSALPSHLPPASRYALVTDDRLAPLYGEKIVQLLSHAGLETSLFLFPHGEKSTNLGPRKSTSKINCSKKGWGGFLRDRPRWRRNYRSWGVCGCHLLPRGPFSHDPHLPFSHGRCQSRGRNGVNVPYGKNLLGSLYQPKKSSSTLTPFTLCLKKSLRMALWKS